MVCKNIKYISLEEVPSLPERLACSTASLALLLTDFLQFPCSGKKFGSASSWSFDMQATLVQLHGWGRALRRARQLGLAVNGQTTLLIVVLAGFLAYRTPWAQSKDSQPLKGVPNFLAIQILSHWIVSIAPDCPAFEKFVRFWLSYPNKTSTVLCHQ